MGNIPHYVMYGAMAFLLGKYLVKEALHIKVLLSFSFLSSTEKNICKIFTFVHIAVRNPFLIFYTRNVFRNKV